MRLHQLIRPPRSLLRRQRAVGVRLTFKLCAKPSACGLGRCTRPATATITYLTATSVATQASGGVGLGGTISDTATLGEPYPQGTVTFLWTTPTLAAHATHTYKITYKVAANTHRTVTLTAATGARTTDPTTDPTTTNNSTSRQVRLG